MTPTGPVPAVPNPAAANPAGSTPAGSTPGSTPAASSTPSPWRATTPAPPGLDLPWAVPPALTRFWSTREPAATAAVLGACLGVGLVAGPLTVGVDPGLGLAVALALTWVAAAPRLLAAGRRSDLLLAAVSVACVAVTAWRDAPWLVATCLLVAGLTAVTAAGAARSAQGLLLAVPTAVLAAVRAAPWLHAGARRALGGRRERAVGLARAVAVAVALVLVFGLLFASADRAFAALVPDLRLTHLPAWVVVGALAALVTAALAQLSAGPPSWASRRPAAARPAHRAEWLIPLVALDGLFVAFVAVQLVGVLGGHQHVVDTAGLSYAGYARHGFAQLVVATALTLAVVAVAVRRAPRATARDRRVAQVVLGVLTVATLGVVASALRRVDLYVEAYGMTRLRLLAITGELFLGVVLLLVLAAGVRWRAGWLPRAVLLAGAASVLALAAMNPEARIVRADTAADLGRVDVDYLRGLSADAVPAMAELAEPLRSCLLAGAPLDGPDGVRDWNLGRARAGALQDDIWRGRTAPIATQDGDACVGYLATSAD